MKLLRIPASPPVGVPLPWFAWRPVFLYGKGELVWWEPLYRTRWHSPMGHWYFSYGRKPEEANPSATLGERASAGENVGAGSGRGWRGWRG